MSAIPELDLLTYRGATLAQSRAIGADFAAGSPGGIQSQTRAQLRADAAAVVTRTAKPGALAIELEHFREVLEKARLSHFGAGGPHDWTL